MLELTIFIKYENDDPMDVIEMLSLDNNVDNYNNMVEQMASAVKAYTSLNELGLIEPNVKEIYGHIYHYTEDDPDADGDIIAQFSLEI